MLADAGDLIGEPRPITHPVKFYERGDRPLEIVSTRQWYLRNGGRDEALRATLLARGEQLHWVPAHMKHRYDNWVGGLNGDWLVSRQRFFGVPVPVWYRLDDTGEPDWSHPLTPDESALPVDPSSDPAPGYDESQRGQPGGFIGDPDVLDTWATSSLTPQIVGGWETDPDLFARVFPMDLRPQGQEIIRTWLFDSVVRSHFEHGVLPWRDTVLSGWILDPDHKKMAKSKGNVVTPLALLEQHGSDAVRYWAASGKPGMDLAFDPAQIKVGRRLATKLLNASKFALGLGAADALRAPATPTTGPGHARRAGHRGHRREHRLRLVRPHGGVAGRPRRSSGGSATTTSSWSRSAPTAPARRPTRPGRRWPRRCSVQLRLFAPVLPYVTEEIWSWWRYGSVHRAPWPTTYEVARTIEGSGDAGAAAARR